MFEEGFEEFDHARYVKISLLLCSSFLFVFFLSDLWSPLLSLSIVHARLRAMPTGVQRAEKQVKDLAGNERM